MSHHEASMDAAQEVEKYKIHNFIRKMLQEDIFDKLIEYIGAHIKRKKGEALKFRHVNPVSINLDLITACNYYCDHCIDLDIINNGHALRFDNIKSLLSGWVDGGLKSVIVIGGGEPTLHPDFEEIIAFLKSKRLEVGIASNGSRLNRLVNVVPLLSKKDWVRLSLDAASDEVFQKIHTPKSKINLEQILNDAKAMREKYSEYQLGFSFLVISDDHIANNKNLVNNIGEISTAAKKAKESGFSYFSVKPFISPSGHRPTRFQRSSIEEIIRQIELAKEFEDDNFKVIESLNLLALLDGSDKRLRTQPKPCHAQFFRVAVCPDGVFNCTLWRGFEMSYLADAQQEVKGSFFKEFNDRVIERIENFDAARECSEVSCIYNDFNWFIEDMIHNPEKVRYLKKTGEFYDYFL